MVADKMVRTKWYTEKIVLDKMVRTIWYGQNGTSLYFVYIFIQNNTGIMLHKGNFMRTET